MSELESGRNPEEPDQSEQNRELAQSVPSLPWQERFRFHMGSYEVFEPRKRKSHHLLNEATKVYDPKDVSVLQEEYQLEIATQAVRMGLNPEPFARRAEILIGFRTRNLIDLSKESSLHKLALELAQVKALANQDIETADKLMRQLGITSENWKSRTFDQELLIVTIAALRGSLQPIKEFVEKDALLREHYTDKAPEVIAIVKALILIGQREVASYLIHRLRELVNKMPRTRMYGRILATGEFRSLDIEVRLLEAELGIESPPQAEEELKVTTVDYELAGLLEQAIRQRPVNNQRLEEIEQQLTRHDFNMPVRRYLALIYAYRSDIDHARQIANTIKSSDFDRLVSDHMRAKTLADIAYIQWQTEERVKQRGSLPVPSTEPINDREISALPLPSAEPNSYAEHVNDLPSLDAYSDQEKAQAEKDWQEMLDRDRPDLT